MHFFLFFFLRDRKKLHYFPGAWHLIWKIKLIVQNRDRLPVHLISSPYDKEIHKIGVYLSFCDQDKRIRLDANGKEDWQNAIHFLKKQMPCDDSRETSAQLRYLAENIG